MVVGICLVLMVILSVVTTIATVGIHASHALFGTTDITAPVETPEQLQNDCNTRGDEIFAQTYPNNTDSITTIMTNCAKDNNSYR